MAAPQQIIEDSASAAAAGAAQEPTDGAVAAGLAAGTQQAGAAEAAAGTQPEVPAPEHTDPAPAGGQPQGAAPQPPDPAPAGEQPGSEPQDGADAAGGGADAHQPPRASAMAFLEPPPGVPQPPGVSAEVEQAGGAEVVTAAPSGSASSGPALPNLEIVGEVHHNLKRCRDASAALDSVLTSCVAMCPASDKLRQQVERFCAEARTWTSVTAVQNV